MDKQKIDKLSYRAKMVNKQLAALEKLARDGTIYTLGGNYVSYSKVRPEIGFDCASCALYGIESAIDRELITGNQNVILNEAKKKDGYMRYLKPGEKVEDGDLVLVNYPSGNKYDMGAYSYAGFYYPNPEDHIYTVGRRGKTIDTGRDSAGKAIIKEGIYEQSVSFYIKMGAKLTFLRVRYNHIKNKLGLEG